MDERKSQGYLFSSPHDSGTFFAVGVGSFRLFQRRSHCYFLT